MESVNLTPGLQVILEQGESLVAPGGSLAVPFSVINAGGQLESVQISIQGLPLTWLLLPPAAFQLNPGEKRSLILTIEPPASPATRVGHYPYTIRAANPSDPQRYAQAQALLTVAAFESSGRISILMNATQFTIAPGKQVEVSFMASNHGLLADDLKVIVEGFPLAWVTTHTPLIHLGVGEQKQTSLVISPPYSPQSSAGRKPFKIQLISQGAAEKVAEIACVLTVAAFSEHRVQLAPRIAEAGQPVQISLSNQGNVQETYQLDFSSEADGLTFAPHSSQQVRIQPGQAAALQFTAQPRSNRLFGGDLQHPYIVQVSAGGQVREVIQGSVHSRARFPMWMIPVALILAAALLCIGFFVLRSLWGGSAAGDATVPPETLTAVVSQTEAAAVTQTVSANQTAAAAMGEQDSDGDGLLNREEGQYGTDPNNSDTDGDKLLDGDEVKNRNTDPLNPDTDQDQLLDSEEINPWQTDPRNPDTDGDGLLDGDEARRGTNPRDPDTDRDNLGDRDELERKTDPLKEDTDGDALKDGDEVRLNTDPLNPDTDNDALPDGKELPPCPDPRNPDTDNDGLQDGKEAEPCNPLNPTLTAGAPTATATLPPAVISPTPTATPTVVPLPGVLLFETNRDGNSEIYAQNGASRAITRLTISPAQDTQPAWSPDRSRIAFASNLDGDYDIYLMNADGTGVTNLTANAGFDETFPAWSLDGALIAFTSNRDGQREIYSVATDGTNLLNLTNDLMDDFAPAWFPGGRIAFTTNRSGDQEIFVMNSDGSGLVNLTNNSADDFSPSVAADGSRIAFTSDRDGNLEVYLMASDGSGQSNLTRSGSQDQQAVWSPDNNWLAFVTNREGNPEIYVIRPDGSGALNFSLSPAAENYPAWR